LTNNRIKIEMLKRRFCILFSKMWKIRAMYKIEKIGERADPWPTPTFVIECFIH